ncbi:MAG: XRE family transcriptional regulator [Bacteroidales bacterium]|jgi:plasmid maintenance system antidote protein VapI|nr:XRE family transcriptional regulator [Bacteroidales bacterium]MBP5419323.1 XRE family transcriptional regulator [Bacteroidales bacterium]
MPIHIGKLIREELKRQERSVTWFARHLNCERTNVYNIFKRDSIDTALLARISTILNRDFFRDLSESTTTSRTV